MIVGLTYDEIKNILADAMRDYIRQKFNAEKVPTVVADDCFLYLKDDDRPIDSLVFEVKY